MPILAKRKRRLLTGAASVERNAFDINRIQVIPASKNQDSQSV